MEMALMQQQAALRSLHSAPATSALGTNGRQRCGGCGNSGLTVCTLGSRRGLSSSGWNWRAGRESSRRGFHPPRSSGGTRRDEGKQVARTQKRRSRHVKGVTPTKGELYDELRAEEESDDQLNRSEEDFESALQGNASNSSDGTSAEPNFPSNGKAKGEEETLGEGSDRSNTSSSGVEEIVDAGADTYVIKYFPDGKGGPKGARRSVGDAAEDIATTAQDAAQDVLSSAAEDAQEAGESVGENLEEMGEEVGEVVDEVSEVAQDTAEDVTSTVQEAAESTGKSLSEAGDEIQTVFDELGEELPAAAAEIGEIVQDTAQDLMDTAEETAEEVGESLEEAGEAVSETLDEVRAEGEKLVNEGERYTREQMEESRKEMEDNLSTLGNQLQEASDRAGQAFEKVSTEAEKSLKNVQESLVKLVEDSARASGTIGNEALRLGEVVLNVAGEAAGFQGTKEEFSTSDRTNAGQVVKERPQIEENKTGKRPKAPVRKVDQEIESTRYKSSLPNEDLEEDKSPYKGLKVTVAGATGRTGRLLVEELARKGVPVRALVRDKNKSEVRDLRKFSNVEVVQVDLYKYEAVKKAIGDCNIVISAVGARSFAFDPIGTYQAEFEGVKNLIAAAKNKGDVKKFVFITALGVTFLQIVPLIFWKKQSELYLQRSGLDYTIVRPGGLTNRTGSREAVTMKTADTQFGGSISRQKVAEVCVAALITPEASEKIVEIVSGGQPDRSFSDLFGSV
ncbi:unnamed protein product [Calypogeia fissa]